MKFVTVLACEATINLNSMKTKSSDVEFHLEVSYKQTHILGLWWSFLEITKSFIPNSGGRNF